ncbi:MAG: hypothetical protein OXE95_07705 [Chloroflexi bacterium]|nr:hypothetical protein [Chloroflexota bacterium]MCY4247442.1 hypothetical protein [Chloroflexota bacterium]
MMLGIEQLGINPTHMALTALWIASYCFAVAWLIRCARAGLVKRTWLWGLVILFVPAGQFATMLWLFSMSQKAKAK